MTIEESQMREVYAKQSKSGCRYAILTILEDLAEESEKWEVEERTSHAYYFIRSTNTREAIKIQLLVNLTANPLNVKMVLPDLVLLEPEHSALSIMLYELMRLRLDAEISPEYEQLVQLLKYLN